MTKKRAKLLQRWALEACGAKEFIRNLPVLYGRQAKQGIYVCLDIDETELDGGMDFPDVRVVLVVAVLKDGTRKQIGEIMAYNWERIWLSAYESESAAREWDWNGDTACGKEWQQAITDLYAGIRD